ncbi:MAG: OmpA family protein [Terriglobales bacterium]
MNVRAGSWMPIGRSFALAVMVSVAGTALWATPPDGGPGAALPAAGLHLDTVAATPLPNPFEAFAAAAQAATADSGSFIPSQMQGSLAGTPGLWGTQFAETLAPGQVSSGAYLQRYSRSPGGLVFTDVNTGWTVGITRWLELTFATTPYRRVRLTHPEQLTFGPMGTLGSFNPEAPFARNALLHGAADWSLGATVGLLSQDRGDKFGLGLQFGEHVPYHTGFTQGALLYGVTTTEPWFEYNVLLDKRIGTGGEMVGNFGYQHNGTVNKNGVYLPLQDQFNWGFGEIFPLRSRLQGIVELAGSKYFGAGANPVSTDPFLGQPAPLDLTGGIRFNPLSWMGINAGYRFAGNSPASNASGFVFGLSFGPPVAHPAPPPPPPTLACQVDQSPVQPGTSVQISSTVSPEGQTYTYTWITTGGQLTPNGGSATLDTTGLNPGLYTITGKLSNAAGQTASCSTSVEVREPVRHPPTASCSVSPDSVLPGGSLTLTGEASSPDNRPLTYAWTVEPASAGHLDSTSQATVHLDTTGATPGSVTGRLTVTDDRGLSASCSAGATIQTPPPPPQASLATTFQFKPNSSRVDNVAKAALDDVALRLQQDASAKAVIVGYATSSEVQRRRPLSAEATVRLAEERAVHAKQYLVNEKGIASDRIEVRQADGPHQAEVWIVPQGASYTGAGVPFDESVVKH